MTTTVWRRGSKYGTIEMFDPSGLDPDAILTEDQFDALVESYGEKIVNLLDEKFPGLIWMPELSEIWCDYDNPPDIDPEEFDEWWDSGGGYKQDFLTALEEAWVEVEESK